jgi:hypothetical protein
MYFKSLFAIHPGTQVFIHVDGDTISQIPARVAWCKKLDDKELFRYGIGVELLISIAKWQKEVSISKV